MFSKFVLCYLVSMYFAAFDEDGQPYGSESDIVVTLQDPSKIKVHTWYKITGSQGNYINEYGTEGRSLYSSDHAKSSSFNVEKEDKWSILENEEITQNINGKSEISRG